MWLIPEVASVHVHEEKCSGSQTEAVLVPRRTCSERAKGRTTLAWGTAL